MSRRKRIPRRPRTRTAESVVRTHIAVIAGIEDATTFKNINVNREVELVKASLLYADDVEVLRLGNQMIREYRKFSDGNPTNLWSLFGSFDDETLRQLAPDTDPDALRQMAKILMNLSPDDARAMTVLDPSLAELTKFADVLEQTQSGAVSTMEEMRQVTDSLYAKSGVAELELPAAQQLVRFNNKVFFGGDIDAMIGAFRDQFARYLQDPKMLVVLDEQMSSLARNLIAEGHIRLPERSVSNAGEALLGTGFLARLPAFTNPPMDEILDLRSDLNEPLSRYRKAIAQMHEQLLTGPFDQNADAEVDALWRAEVDPAIIEIRHALADHSLVREQLRAFSLNLGDFVKNGTFPGLLTVLVGNRLHLSEALTGALTLAIGTAPTVGKGIMARSQGKRAARANDLFYLYEVDRRLAH